MMSDADKQTHYDLLHRIEKNDRRFRFAQSIFMTIIGLVLVGLIAAQFLVIRSFQEQSAERASGIKALQEDNQSLLKENKHLSEQTNRYIQCIAQFFATTDRQTRVLSDLDKCTYEQNGRAIPGVVLPQSSDETTNSPAPVDSQNTGSGSSGAGEGSTSGNAENTPAARKVFGIPVCVPFTQFCVRQ